MILLKSAKSSAPALDAGLDVLEFLSLRKEAGFNELCNILPMSKASVSRILKTLSERGYVRKDSHSGKWLPGPRIGMAGMSMPISEILRTEAPKILKSLVDVTGNTAICVYWNGEEFQVVAKEQRDGSIAMIEVGTISRDLSRFPWGWLFFLSLDKDARRKAMKHFEDATLFKRRIEPWRKHIDETGFAFDDHEIYPNRMRFGAAIYDVNGRIIGALGSTGTRLSIETDKIDEFGAELLRHADILSKILRHTGQVR